MSNICLGRENNYWISRMVLCAAVALLFGGTSLSWADLSQQEARIYREKGYYAQRRRDYDQAFMFYKKALALDPSYAAVYNDLGVIYEYRRDKVNALKAYRRALQINPDYARTYYNLGAFYERKGDFLKASFYWRQRISMGDPKSAGTLRAKERLWRISQIYPHIARQIKEEEAQILALQVEASKQKEKKLGRGKKDKAERYRKKQVSRMLLEMDEQGKNPAGAADREVTEYVSKGRQAYDNNDYPAAIKHFSDAAYLDPRNQKVQKMLEESQKKLLLQ